MGITSQPDTDLVERIRRLETRVEELSRGTLANAVVSDGGITIRDLGGLQQLDRDGETTFFVGGRDGSWARPDGSPQPVAFIADDRGAWRIGVLDPDPQENGYRQFVALWDYSGNIIVSDEVNSGQGLARPLIPSSGFRPIRAMDMPKTQSTTWETLQWSWHHKQHTNIGVVIGVGGYGDSVGEARIVVGGVQYGETVTSPPGAFRYAHVNFRIPGDHVSAHWMELQARRASGAHDIVATAHGPVGGHI
ncbi:hypothetical protein NLX83_13700 [Allokutzneria sp. A3M-2-11 16]|uniref:hypothetical protein n=1 Tax=Allokutzneria sp. A3M-2-11 16 TaxID=2962043 RepID=UPI0020B8FEF6|nr:hypothetical protein [Allokutzneria sp. A3M-2-11 16]MCP3800313.1 hypothetical protein [Allokutzneria sp. A3M-2-11 16]